MSTMTSDSAINGWKKLPAIDYNVNIASNSLFVNKKQFISVCTEGTMYKYDIQTNDCNQENDDQLIADAH